MFAAALIVFREVLEAALVITIIMAATQGVPRRGYWISLGIAGGVAGAGVVAAMANILSTMFEGAGQDIVNASVLFLAVGLIGWHVVWMNSHGRKMAADMREMGRCVVDGEKHMSILAVVIGLAVMREGSEVVLMLQGLWAGGSTVAMLGGLAVGLAAGVLMSSLMYFGFVALPVGRVFALTNGILILIAAGMAARGANFLVQAGFIPSLGGRLWDTSNVLSDQSLLGQIFAALVGYIARPNGTEVLCYGVTVAAIIGLMYVIKSKNKREITIAAAVLLFLSGTSVFVASPAFAIDKIYSPNITQGEWELEYFGTRTFDNHADKNNIQEHEMSVGYGVTDYWMPEFYGLLGKDAGQPTKMTGVQFENHFQFFEPGEYWVDPGLLVAYTQAVHQQDPNGLEVKLLLEKQTGQFLHRINTGIEQEVGPHSQGGPDYVFAWGSRYRYNVHFEPGFEIQDDFGKTTDHLNFNQQQHYVGPSFYGEIIPHVKYEAAYLFGVSDAASSGAARFQIEYEMFFE